MSHSILWFAPHFQTGTDAGGLRTWALARHLAQRGDQVSVIVPGWDPLTCRRLMPIAKLSSSGWVDGVEVIHVWSLRNDRSRRYRRLGYFLTQSISALMVGLRRPKPDLVIAANYPPTLAMSALLVARLRRLPFVLEVRDFPAEAAIASGYVKSKFFGRVVLRLERALFKPAERIVTVGPGMERRMIELGVAADKIDVISNGYEESLFEAADFDRDIRGELGWGDRFVVLYAGTLGHIPDLSTLLATAAMTTDDDGILYVIVGGGQREEEYRAFCQRNGLDNCQFLGRRPRIEIPLFCRAADVCVNLFPKHPLWGSILGNKSFDYLGSGTPYVYCGSEPSDTADLLRASGGGLVVGAEDPAGLLAALTYLRDHPAERHEMGERGRRYVVQHYSRHKIAQQFEGVLSETLRNGHR